MAAPLILAEATPRRATDGTAVTLRFAGGGGELPYHYVDEHWRAGIVDLPPIVASLDFDEKDLTSGGIARATAIEWAPGTIAGLAKAANLVWNDAPITLRIGPEGAFPPIALEGRVMQATIRAGRLQLALADPAVALKKPFAVDRFAGSGGLEGPVEFDGRVKKRVFGRVWNSPGIPIDPANNIYCFADPSRPLQAIAAVRDKGAATDQLIELEWQGSAEETLTALQTAEAPQGGGVACPSIACVKWWTQPKGDLTADLEGEIGTGYVETTAEIVERIVNAIAGPAFAPGTVAAAAAACPAAIGWVIDDDSTAVSQMLDELLGNVSLLWVLSAAGEIVLREWAWGPSTRTVKATSIERSRTIRPVGTVNIGYLRNELPMARNSLAAIVLVDDLDVPPEEVLNSQQQWDDIQDATGTRPEDNADVTASNQHSIGDVDEVEVAADYSGSIPLGALPVVRSVRRLVGTTDVSADTIYKIESTSGCEATINNTVGADERGDVTVTEVTAAKGSITVSAQYAGIPLYKQIPVKREDASPPLSGSGNATASTTALSNPGIFTTHQIMTATLAVPVGASGEVKLTAPVVYSAEMGDQFDQTSMAAKWQYSADGTSGWSDVASEIYGSAALRWFQTDFPKGQRDYPGEVFVTQSKTGLASGATAYFRLVGRMIHGGRGIANVGGTASATPQ